MIWSIWVHHLAWNPFFWNFKRLAAYALVLHELKERRYFFCILWRFWSFSWFFFPHKILWKDLNINILLSICQLSFDQNVKRLYWISLDWFVSQYFCVKNCENYNENTCVQKVFFHDVVRNGKMNHFFFQNKTTTT